MDTENRKRASFFYEPKVAATLDRETIYIYCLGKIRLLSPHVSKNSKVNSKILVFLIDCLLKRFNQQTAKYSISPASIIERK